MAFSPVQKAIIALGLFFMGWLSLICNGFIVYKIYLRHREYRQASGLTKYSYQMTTYHRILLGMSFLDILFSIACAAGTFAVPTSTGVAFGHGTLATCATQGFFFQFGFALPVYIASLTTFFMLKIRYNVSDMIMKRRYEPWLHIVPFLYGFTFAIIGASLKLFNPIILPELGCWVSEYPAGCDASGTCTRGFAHAEIINYLLWVFGFGWLVASFFVVVVNSILIYTAIRSQEKRNTKYQMPASSTEMKPNSLLEQSRRRFASIKTSSVFFVRDNASDPVISQEIKHDEEGIRTDVEVDQAKILAAIKANVSSSVKSPGEKISESVPDRQNTVEVGDKKVLSLSNATVMSSFTNNKVHNERSARLVNGRKQVDTSRVAAVQSSLFCASTFFISLWTLLPWIFETSTVITTRTRFFFALMSNIIAPSQGVFNLIIFVRLQYMKLRETQTEWSRFTCLVHCLTTPASDK